MTTKRRLRLTRCAPGRPHAVPPVKYKPTLAEVLARWAGADGAALAMRPACKWGWR